MDEEDLKISLSADQAEGAVVQKRISGGKHLRPAVQPQRPPLPIGDLATRAFDDRGKGGPGLLEGRLQMLDQAKQPARISFVHLVGLGLRDNAAKHGSIRAE